MKKYRIKKQYRTPVRLSCLGCFGTIMLVVFAICRCSCGGCSGKDDTEKAEQRIVHLNDTLTNALVDVPELHDMDSIMRRYLKRWELNGAQLAVTRNDSLLYVKGYGWADKERNVLMEPCHIMRMASVSKLVTAVGIMKLQEMGRLKLSDKVFGPQGILNDTTYTNSIRDKRYYDITVEQLLRHKAGFNNYAGDPMSSTRYIMMQNRLTTPPTHRELLRILLRRHLGYTPGTGRCYSNLGYTILSMIIEKRSGMSYEQFMQDKVLRPAGCFDFHIAGIYYRDRRPNEVRYYMHGGSEPVYEYNNSGKKVDKCYGDTDIPRLAGAGAWAASAAELSRLIASIDGCSVLPDVISPQSVKAMTQQMPSGDYSLGWNYTPVGRPWIRTGSLSGTSALVMRYPDGQCWILLTNTSTWKGHGFSIDTISLFEKLRKKYMKLMPKRNLFGVLDEKQ